MGMHYCQQGQLRPTHFVVTCKRCDRAIPAGVTIFPTVNLVIECALCGELRRYRPSEVYKGSPDVRIQPQRSIPNTRRRTGT